MTKNRPFLDRLAFACAGIVAAWRGELSFRTQTLFALLLIGFLCWLRPAPHWWAILLTVTGLVLAAELFNSELERTLDHLHPDYHPMIKIAKNCAAGAVLIAALAALGVFIAFLVSMGLFDHVLRDL